MRTYLTVYAATIIAFLGLDFVWLSLSTNAIYKERLGQLLLDKPNLPVAAVFYLFYAVGIVVFAVMPAQDKNSWLKALGMGALLGLIAYGTYDMTNLATLKNWSASVSLIDMAWGAVATGTASVIGYIVAHYLGKTI